MHEHRCSQPRVALESREQRRLLLLLLLSYDAGISGFLFFLKKMGRFEYIEWDGSRHTKMYCVGGKTGCIFELKICLLEWGG